MPFDSPAYAVFLVLVVAIYWQLRFRAQNVFLLGASYAFYGWWDWRFAALMAASTTMDFVFARLIAGSANPSRRRGVLLASLCVNFGILGFFKYFNFFADSFITAARNLGFSDASAMTLSIVLPAGISFYTFQEVAYVIDVYSGRVKAAESIVDYALFISLFPHLIAGPIQRPSHLLPQVQVPRAWDAARAFDGVMLILQGLVRKCVVADQCALVANAAFDGRLGPPSVPVVLLGTYAFAWQIYGDFSGYSDIARGSAQLLGFHFMVNFRQPYLAESLQDFWRRWHISLSTWLRDYLYVPLGGNRHGERRTYGNLLTTMVLGGLWHGANWTFVVWGGIHGAGLTAERALGLRPLRGHAFLWRWARRIVIFHVVCIAWIFFRSSSVAMAAQFIDGLGRWAWLPEYGVAVRFLIVFITPMFLLDLHLERSRSEYLLAEKPWIVRAAAATAMTLFIAALGANEANAFIYFQF